MNNEIKFGTDGWRAVIGREFTFDNLSRLARATALWLKQSRSHSPKVIVGHDTRFMARSFAEHVAQEIANEGGQVILASGPTPTPAISWATLHQAADAGVVITASHNPPEYSGYKIKTHYGGPASPEMTAAIEQRIEPFCSAPISDREGSVQEVDITSKYVDYLKSQFDLDSLNLKVVHDSMYGAGQGILSRLLDDQQVREIHGEINPAFGGRPPEPIERNLKKLMSFMAHESAEIGIAHDGDADRIGVVDEKGNMVTSHMVMALLAAHFYKWKRLQGAIVRTFATSEILRKMGDKWGLPVETYPIGFKHIASRFLETDVLVGGEESGGIAVMGHIPERDGIYVALELLEMLIQRGKPLSALVQDLFDEFGPHAYFRSDVHTEKQSEIVKALQRTGGLSQIAGREVKVMDNLDGFKHCMEDAWLLVRPSGTEPVLRIYAEAPTREEAEALVQDTMAQFGIST